MLPVMVTTVILCFIGTGEALVLCNETVTKLQLCSIDKNYNKMLLLNYKTFIVQNLMMFNNIQYKVEYVALNLFMTNFIVSFVALYRVNMSGED